MSEIDLYSFKENPVAAALSPAKWISNASALICSTKKIVCSAYPTIHPLFDVLFFFLSCRQYTWKSNTQNPVNYGVSINTWISCSYRTDTFLMSFFNHVYVPLGCFAVQNSFRSGYNIPFLKMQKKKKQPFVLNETSERKMCVSLWLVHVCYYHISGQC